MMMMMMMIYDDVKMHFDVKVIRGIITGRRPSTLKNHA